MRIRFLGGAAEVTGSTHMLMTDHSIIMRDCGLFQGHRADARDKNRTILNGVDHVDAVVLSHAHIDHCGNLPTLVQHGYSGPIYATQATRALCEHMLRDSAHIQALDAEYLNRKKERKDEPLVEPLYTIDHVEQALTLFEGHAYNEPIKITENVAVTAYDAGHVLGSALHVFDVEESGWTQRIGYAFDLGRKNLPILHDPTQLNDIDALVIESTYGDRVHKDIRETETMFANVINRTCDRGGKIIVPSFALERSQEVLYMIERLFSEQRIPRLPIFLDSPLAINVTEVFRQFTDMFDREARELLQSGGHFLCEDFVTCIRDVEESKLLNDDTQPMIIISASGMCEAGRILHHLKNNIENPRNTILIVGYQAEHTLGRRIVERCPKVKIFGVDYKLNAEVAVINSFSGHADRNDLLKFIDNVSERCTTFIFVHGEARAIDSLTTTVRERRPKARIEVPSRGDELEL